MPESQSDARTNWPRPGLSSGASALGRLSSGDGSDAGTRGYGARALVLLPWLLAFAPLVVVPGLADFSRLPQQAFIQISAVVLVFVWALGGSGAGPGAARVKLFDIPVGVFLGLSALSLVGGSDRAGGLHVLAHWVSCALVYGMVSRLVVRPAQARPLIAGLFGGAVAVALIGLAQALLHIDLVPTTVGPAGTLANRNVAAGYLVTTLPLGLALWHLSGTRGRRAVATGAAVILVFLPFTLARVAAVALALQLLVLGRASLAGRRRDPSSVSNLWQMRRAAPRVAAAALVVAAACLTLAIPAKARSLSIRGSLAAAAVSMARENPVLGVGLGSFGDQYARFGEPIRGSGSPVPLLVESAHNEPLQVLAETGVPALLVLLWIAVTAVSGLARLRRSQDPQVRATAWALGLSLVGLAVDGAFGFPLRTSVGPLGVAVLLGLLASLEARERHPLSPGEQATKVRLVPPAVPATLIVLILAPPLAWSVSRQGTPSAPAQSASADDRCSPDVHLTARADKRLDLVATDAPLSEVLDCLADRTGLRVEIDGSPPRQQVSANIDDEPLASVVTQVLTGSGVDYLLGYDPTGVHLKRVIIVESSSPASRPRPAAGRAPERLPAGAGSSPEAGSFRAGPVREGDIGSSPEADPSTIGPTDPGYSAEPGAPQVDPYGEPDWEGPDPGYERDPTEPAELSPMTLRRRSIPSPTALARSAHAPSGS